MRLSARISVCVFALLASGAVALADDVAVKEEGVKGAAASAERGRIGGGGGNGLAPVSSKADEAACTQAGRALVTRDGKPFCGKPLDAAGEAACLKDGGRQVAIGTQKFCEMPAASPPAVPPRKGNN